MTEYTSSSFHDLVRRIFAMLEARDLEVMMRLFADDAGVINITPFSRRIA
jgi:ketosteroid isomerase-like protein